MPSYYYAAAGGALLLLVLLLVSRAQKAKAAKAADGPATPAADGPATPAAEGTRSKRATKAGVRGEAKAAAKAAAEDKTLAKAAARAEAKAAKAGDASAAPKSHSRRGKRREPVEETSRTLEVPVLQSAPAYVQHDGWLTTADVLADIVPGSTEAAPAEPELHEPSAPAYVPQQPNPADGEPAFAMAAAPASATETFSDLAAAPVAARQTSFSELADNAVPAAPAAPDPVQPDVPLGPYTYGARTILPGKR
jgi:hypothetical protein